MIKKQIEYISKLTSKYFRPQEVDHLRGNFKKAKKYLTGNHKLTLKK